MRNITIAMETYMKENLKITKEMVMAYIIIQMEIYSKEIGKIVSLMDME